MKINIYKLVRDKIPDIIKNNNEEPIIRILDDEEYKKELSKKLIEEANEVVNAKTKEELVQELADLYEVIDTIAKINNIKINTIREQQRKNNKKNGKFNKRIYLEYKIINKK